MASDPNLYVLGFQILAALGTPGVTFYVMKKMTGDFQKSSKEFCARCKAEIERRLQAQESRDKEIEGRQAFLRETTLPQLREEYVKQADLDKSTRDIQGSIAGLRAEVKESLGKVSQDIRTVHGRIDDLHTPQKSI